MPTWSSPSKLSHLWNGWGTFWAKGTGIPVSSLLRENSRDALFWIYKLDLICSFKGVLHFQFTFYNRLNVCQMGSCIFYGELTSKPSRFTLFLWSYWVPPGLLVSSNHFHGTQPEQPGREDRPLSPSSKQLCSRGDPAWALLILFWCFSSFVDSHWKYAKINVSTALHFKSHFQSSQHKTNLKNSSSF